MQQLRAELLGSRLPQFAGSLRQPHIAGAFGICDAIHPRAARMAATAMRRRELVKADDREAASG